MRIPDNSFSRTDFSGVGRNEGTQLPEGTQHNPPPAKTSLCPLSVQPPRSVEDREYMTHCGPQEPVGIEGNSACALKLSRRGVSDVEKFIQGKLEAAAPATLREDKSWLWILSAYGLSKPPASHVVEQLLRKALESTRRVDLLLDRREALPSPAFLLTALLKGSTYSSIVAVSEEQSERRHIPHQHGEETLLVRSNSSPVNCNSSTYSCGATGTLEAESPVEMTPSENFGNDITGNGNSSSSIINSSISNISSGAGRNNGSSNYSTQPQLSVQEKAEAIPSIDAEKSLLNLDRLCQSPFGPDKGQSATPEVTPRMGTVVETAGTGEAQGIGEFPASEAEFSSLSGSLEPGADDSLGDLRAPVQMPPTADVLEDPSEVKGNLCIAGSYHSCRGDSARQTVESGAAYATSEERADEAESSFSTNKRGLPAAASPVITAPPQPKVIWQTATADVRNRAFVSYGQYLSRRIKALDMSEEQVIGFPGRRRPPRFSRRWGKSHQLCGNTPQDEEDRRAGTEEARAEVEFIRANYMSPIVQIYLRGCAHRGFRIPGIEDLPPWPPTREQVIAFSTAQRRQLNTSLCSADQTTTSDIGGSTEDGAEAAATNGAPNAGPDNAKHNGQELLADGTMPCASEDLEGPSQPLSGTNSETASESNSETVSETASETASRSDFDGSDFDGSLKEESESPDNAAGDIAESAPDVTPDSLGDADVAEDTKFNAASDVAPDAASDALSDAAFGFASDVASEDESDVAFRDASAAESYASSDAKSDPAEEGVSGVTAAHAATNQGTGIAQVPVVPGDALRGFFSEQSLPPDSPFISPFLNPFHFSFAPPSSRSFPWEEDSHSNGCWETPLGSIYIQQQPSTAEREKQESQKEQEQQQSLLLQDRRRYQERQQREEQQRTLFFGGMSQPFSGFAGESIHQTPQSKGAQQFSKHQQHQQALLRPVEHGTATNSTPTVPYFPAVSVPLTSAGATRDREGTPLTPDLYHTNSGVHEMAFSGAHSSDKPFWGPQSPKACFQPHCFAPPADELVEPLDPYSLRFHDDPFYNLQSPRYKVEEREGSMAGDCWDIPPLLQGPAARCAAAVSTSAGHVGFLDKRTKGDVAPRSSQYQRGGSVEHPSSSEPIPAGAGSEEPEQICLAEPASCTGTAGPRQAAEQCETGKPFQEYAVQQWMHKIDTQMESLERLMHQLLCTMEVITAKESSLR